MSEMILSGDAYKPANRNPLTVQWSDMDSLYNNLSSKVNNRVSSIKSLGNNTPTVKKVVEGVVNSLQGYQNELNKVKATHSGLKGTLTSNDELYINYIDVNAKYCDIGASIDVVFNEGNASVTSMVSSSKGK